MGIALPPILSVDRCHRPASRRLLVIIALLALSCSCASQLDENYVPASTATYPPKPKDFRAPIIGHYPNRPYQVIGSARSVLEHDHFIESGLQLSARRHGADAVVLAVNSQLVRTPYAYGGRTIYRQVPGVKTGSVELTRARKFLRPKGCLDIFRGAGSSFAAPRFPL